MRQRWNVSTSGADGVRTRDPHTASVVRYQLRYSPWTGVPPCGTSHTVHEGGPRQAWGSAGGGIDGVVEPGGVGEVDDLAGDEDGGGAEVGDAAGAGASKGLVGRCGA